MVSTRSSILTLREYWMDQVARNLCDDGDGFLTGKRYLIHDRDPLFTTAFLATLAASGVKSVKLPPRTPNFERLCGAICLDRMILFGEDSLRKRNHQGLGNRLIAPEKAHAGNGGAIRRRERLGGMLNYYYRQAA
jgi:hypothetical protein